MALPARLFNNSVSCSQSLLFHLCQSWQDSMFLVSCMFPSSQERDVLWRFILQHSYPLTESNEATWQASAIWAAGNYHSVVVPYSLSASKGNHLTRKVVINGRQNFRKEVLTSYRGQSQTENEGRAQQISLFLQPVSTVFKPRTCCSHHFHCSSRCLEGLWGDKK